MSSKSHKPPGGARHGPSGLWQHDIALRNLAGQVVNRLAHRLHSVTEGESRADGVPPERLCAALLDGDEGLARSMLRAAHQADASLRGAYYGSLAPALRLLGEMWENDELSFLDMSLASGRIFAIMRTYQRDGFRPIHPGAPDRLALLATIPGEEHTMGITMAADLMREAGWVVDLRIGVTEAALVADAARLPYAIIALSGARALVEANLAALIVALRRAAPAARVMLCGQMLALMPGIGARVGADGAESDFDAAMALMESYVAR